VSNQKKILLGQLGRRGDCLYATAVARQIKHDYPNCHLTWAISSVCRSIIINNPYVDAILEINQDTNANIFEVWNQFESVANKKKESGEYDEVFFTQVSPGNLQNYDGTSRSSLFRGYPHPITVPITPVVRLTDEEVNNAKNFVVINNISEKDTVILFECASTSGQSFLTPAYALKTATAVLKENKSVKFILTSDEAIRDNGNNIIDGSVLSFRENAELTKHCNLLVGCSSGISWLATSDWAKPLPQIQLLSQRTRMYASMIQDADYFGLPTDHIIELYDITPQQAANVLLSFLGNGIAETKKKYQQEIPIKFDFYIGQLRSELLSKKQFTKTAQAIQSAKERFGINNIAELEKIIQDILIPYIRYYWPRMNESERTIFTSICPMPTGDNKKILALKSIIHLLKRSFYGEYKKTARPFLLDILTNS
jgi:ADP-heptose:LPS heptosyltransferase